MQKINLFSSNVLFILGLRIWQAISGLATTILAVHFLSLEQQGWYYSFLSVAALYTLFDLGLSTVLVQVSAHFSIHSRWGKAFSFEPPASGNLQALVGRASWWYARMALLFLVIILPSGFLFFDLWEGSGHIWASTWVVLCFFTALGLIPMPFLSILEGSGEVRLVYFIRLCQAIIGSIFCWLAFASHAGLWATVMAPASAALFSLGWLFLKAKPLIATAIKHKADSFNWKEEVWPLQWRLGIGWLCGYLISQINIPILFHMKGAVVAGQLGLSLTIINTLGLVTQSWLTRRIPAMAMAVAKKEWVELDRLYERDFKISAFLYLFGFVGLLVLHEILSATYLADRLLPFWPFLGLLLFSAANQLLGAWSIQLRSFRKEPLLKLIFYTTLLIVPSVLIATHFYSVSGMVVVLDVFYIFICLPVGWRIWRQCNSHWRV